jgi:DNA-binding XRE family transcriptional regulator
MGQRKPADEVLAKWGRNIGRRRELFQPDGTHRTHGAQPKMQRKDLGALMNPPVRESTVFRWEKGTAEPRLDYKLQLARVLEADPELLFPLGVAA